MIKIILTFDYELPLGSVKSYEKGLFEPAEKIINLGKELNVSLCFFADICSAIKFKEWDKEGYYNPFKKQLQRALSYNHDVQLHIHPHWLTSEYNNRTFIPSSDFSLFNFSDERNYSIDKVINEGVKELSEICKVADNSHKIIAYRAGGYSIIGKSNEIFKALRNNGIKIDSSILPNFYLKTPIYTLDFKSIKDNNWKTNGDDDFYEKSENGIWEIPITNMPVSPVYILRRRMSKIINKSVFLECKYQNTGKSMHFGSVKKTFPEKLKELFNPVSLSFDSYQTNFKNLDKIVSYNIKKFEKKTNTIFITAISHPKYFGDYNIALMEEFIVKLKKKYGKEVEFVSYKNLI